jgi:purine-nucleoside phosphorylase
MGVLATEMETAALYCNAARRKKNALTICTVSDCLFDPEIQLSAEERQTSLNNMIELALDTAIKL